MQIYQEEQSKRHSEVHGKMQVAFPNFDKRTNAVVQNRLVKAIGQVSQMVKYGDDTMELAVRDLFLAAGYAAGEFHTWDLVLFEYINNDTDKAVLIDALKFLRDTYPNEVGSFSDEKLRNGINYMLQLKNNFPHILNLSLEMKAVLFEQTASDSFRNLAQAVEIIGRTGEDSKLALKTLECAREAGYDQRYTGELDERLEDMAKKDSDAFFLFQKKEIAIAADAKRSAERKSFSEAAYESLTRKQKKAYDMMEGLKPPFPPNVEDARLAFEENLRSLTYEAMVEINSWVADQETDVAQQADCMGMDKKKELIQYMRKVGFNQDSLGLLDRANGNFAMALDMVSFIEHYPFFTPFLLSEHPLGLKIALFEVPREVLLAFEPIPDLIIPFLESDGRITFLMHLLELNLLSINIIIFVVGNLNALECYFHNESINWLARLFTKCEPPDVLEMLKDCHLISLDRPQVVFECISKANSVKVVVGVLAFFKDLNLALDSINALFGITSIDWRTIKGARNSIGIFLFNRIDVSLNFAAWLMMANRLVATRVLTINEKTQWYRMSGKKMITNECVLEVCNALDSSVLALLYVHQHPKAKDASPDAPNASKIHFKWNPQKEGEGEGVGSYPHLKERVPPVPLYLKQI